MSQNSNTTSTPKTAEPTMADLFNIMTATRADISEITARIDRCTNETNEKVQNLQANVESIAAQSTENSDRIERLEASIEQMKQNQLLNNICISGVPPELIDGNNTSEIVVKIANKLGVQLSAGQFSSYSVANNKFIIARFFNMKHKQTMQNKVRAKRSLMVEEVFTHTSNSQIYLNDHLTPYMNKLFLLARKAKQEGKLASVTSHGSKIRARKSNNDVPIVVVSEKQLHTLIDMDYCNTSTESHQLANDSNTETELTSQSHTSKYTKQNQHKANKTRNNKTKDNQQSHNTNRSGIASGSGRRTVRKRKNANCSSDDARSPKRAKENNTN